MKELTPSKPSINWSRVSENYRYLARDENGLVYLYENRPKIKHDELWAVDDGEYTIVLAFKSLEVGTCDWKDSLVERPKCI